MILVDGSGFSRGQRPRGSADEPTGDRTDVGGGGELRGSFQQVIDALLEPDASVDERLYTRLVFDTVNATLMVARRTPASDDDILAVARRAVLALTAPPKPA